MLDPFDGPRALVANSLQHAQLAERRFDEYKNANPMRAVQRRDPAGGYTIKFVPSKEMPITVLLAAKDAIHNARSALDIMAGEVVTLSGGNPKEVYFPFCKDEAGLEGAIKSKNFDRASPEAIDIVRALQPFHGGNRILRGLHDLDIAGKHKFVVPGHSAGTVTQMKIGGATFINCTFDGQIADVASRDDRPLSFEGPILPTLMFAGNVPFAGKPAIPLLKEFHQHASSIVEAFATLFGR